MQYWKWIGGIIGFFALLFILELAGVGWTRFFQPLKQNVQREVFEETKSYTHGKIQDLGKYYREYQSASVDEKTALRSVVRTRFAEFNENNINNDELRSFLIEMRGY